MTRRRPMSEINLVPLIDVMLVLLIVSMVAVPLLTQGIQVDLPKESNEPIEEQKDPLVITLLENGRIYMNVGVVDVFDEEEYVSEEELAERTNKVVSARPRVPIFLRADSNLEYGKIMHIMSVLQEAGAENVGLITEPPAP